MNRSKKLYILLGILAVICVLTLVVSRYEEKKEKIKNSDEIILEINKEDVTELSWKHETAELAFHKKDEKWVYDEDEAFPVNEEKIEELLEPFQEFGAAFIIENVEDYGQYGLEEPQCSIKLKAGDKEYEIQLGDYSKMDSQRYVSMKDGNVYLVKEDLAEDFGLELKDMIYQEEIPNLEETKEIQFQGTQEYEIVYEEDSENTYCKEDVYFKKDGEKRLPLDTSIVETYLDTVENLQFGEYMTYKATEEELAKYGLDKPELSIKTQYVPQENPEEEEKEPEEFVLHISRDPVEKKQAEQEKEDSQEEEIAAYARVGESGIIYKISGEDYKLLMEASYNELRHQEVMTADFADITQMDISLEGKEYTLTAKEEDDETVWYFQEEKVEIGDLETALTNLEVSEFTEEEPKQKEEIRLTIHLNHEKYPEIEIVLYRYDGSKCLAVLDGEPLALIEREDMVELAEAVRGIVLD